MSKKWSYIHKLKKQSQNNHELFERNLFLKMQVKNFNNNLKALEVRMDENWEYVDSEEYLLLKNEIDATRTNIKMKTYELLETEVLIDKILQD